MSSTSSTSNLEALDVASTNQKYEVFLNFRGCDTRSGFTSHLYSRLSEANIITYRDDKELPEGGQIGLELLQAINESAIAIPIFSVRYAESDWCLKELVEINNRRRSKEMMVMPIFYHVKPSMVRYQTGKFKDAFASHDQKQRYDNDTIDEWRKALKDIADLSGCEIPSDKYRDESELVKDVTKKMSCALKKAHVEIPEDLVGLGQHVQKILEMLSLETLDVRMIGIHGMGGIGKTTLSKFVYNEILSKFEGSSFLEDARSKSIEDLKTKLRSDILADNTTKAKRFGGKKVLIVIDDVDENTQIEYLVGKRGKQDGLGLGSRIILTTRDKDFLGQAQVDESYELSQMNDFHSLQLFCKHAFQKDNPEEDFAILSEKIMKTTGGLPLALEVIGSSLRNKRNKEDWEIKFDKLRNVPHEKVSKKLRTSFDELDDEQKHIFLDIACFFIGLDRRIVLHFWDKRLYPRDAINILEQKSLIKIHDNLLWMHDQLRDLGRKIVRKGGISKLEKQTRLWDPQDGTEIFFKKRGTEHIQGIRVNKEAVKNTALLNEALAKFSNVRLFWRTWVPSFDYPNQPSNSLVENPRVSLNYPNQPSNSLLENPRIFSELRWLSWNRFPHKYIKASNFSLLNLTILNLPNSDFTIEWEGWSQIKMAKNLKVLDLSWCKNLVGTPNFSSHLQLERLILSGCSALVEIHESIGMLKLLVRLDLSSCKKLCKLPKELGYMESLTDLLLFGCEGIVEIPQLSNKVKLEVFNANYCSSLESCISLNNLTSLKKLNLGRTKISLIPDSIGELVHLMELSLIGCSSIKKLPELIGGLVSLTHLYLCESSIEELPNSIGCLKNLIVLKMSYTPIRELPSTIEMAKKLEKIDAGGSELVSGGVPILPESLINLTLPVEIMDSVPNLSNQINLVNFHLHIDDQDYECTLRDWGLRDWAPIESPSPEWMGNLSKAESLELAFPRFTTLHSDLGSLSQLIHLQLVGCINLQNIPKLPSKLTYLEFYHCHKMSKVDELPDNLLKLGISNCKNLRSLPQMSQYKKLELFYLVGCPNVVEIHGRLESLVKLRISNCENLRSLPQMSQYKKLERFYLSKCPNVVEIHGRLESLKDLDIWSCESLVKIPHILNVKTLAFLRISECPKLFHESPIIRREPILTDNPLESEDAQSFMRNMLRICDY